VRDGEGRLSVHLADAVIDATGVSGWPMPLGSGGIPAPGESAAADRIAYGVPDAVGAQREDYLGRRVLVTGGGHSAITAVLALGELAREAPSTRVHWARRTRRPFPALDKDLLAARRELEAAGNALLEGGAPWLTIHDEAEVDEIERRRSGLEVTLCTPEEPITVKVDRIIAANGFRPDRDLHRELEVHECYASGAPMRLAAVLLAAGSDDLVEVPGSEIDLLRNPEPNFFIIGAKSFGRANTFLLPIGRRQAALVLADLGLPVEPEKLGEVEQWLADPAPAVAPPIVR
jgi:hypothetical protein